MVRTNIMEGTVLAFREINEWKFSRPVFLGDTIHVQSEVVELKALPRLKGGAVTKLKALPRLKGGAVTIKLDVVNQKGEVCQTGRWTMLMLSKAA